jgi:hypothetical protein
MKKNMKIISLIITTAVISSSLCIFETQDVIVSVESNEEETGTHSSHNAQDTIEIDQDDLQLNHEVIQYKVVFHSDDVVNVSFEMALQQTGQDFEPMSAFLMITDGNKSIFSDAKAFILFDIPTGTLIDLNVLGKRICVGGKLFNKLLMKTRFRIGSYSTRTEDSTVKNNTVWYITFAELGNRHQEMLHLKLKAKDDSMELVQLERNGKMDFFSSYTNDFEGRYFGSRFLPLLPFGFSVAKNLKKEITTTDGSIIYFGSVGHFKGKQTVEIGDEMYTDENSKYSFFAYYGNKTGTWRVTSSGIGFPWKHMVCFLYVDIDPHVRYLS